MLDYRGGVFQGAVTPMLTLVSDRREGLGLDMTITLGPVRQICWVIFLPGFSDSVDLFGLGAVEEELHRRIMEQMQEFYTPQDRSEDRINVEFRASEPEDFYAGGYAVLEIGGPDPNGLGLFGYDNTREGCLMDAGQDRPFEERTRIEGNLGARFCGENLWYLQDLLPVE